MCIAADPFSFPPHPLLPPSAIFLGGREVRRGGSFYVLLPTRNVSTPLYKAPSGGRFQKLILEFHLGAAPLSRSILPPLRVRLHSSDSVPAMRTAVLPSPISAKAVDQSTNRELENSLGSFGRLLTDRWRQLGGRVWTGANGTVWLTLNLSGI